MSDEVTRQDRAIDTLIPKHEQQSETVVDRVMEQFNTNQPYTEIASALPKEDLAQFAKHALTNFYTVDNTERRVGMEIVAHGDISEEDLPLVAALVREVSVDYFNNHAIHPVSTLERLSAFKCLQKFLDQGDLSEGICAETAGVLINATQGFLNIGDENSAYNTVCTAHSFAQNANSAEVIESLRNVCKTLDEAMQPSVRSVIPQYLGDFEAEYLPEISQAAATMFEENIAESPALAAALVRELDTIKNHPSAERLLTLAVKTSRQAAKSFLQIDGDDFDTEWYSRVKVAAMVALDTTNDVVLAFENSHGASAGDSAEYSRYFHEIPMEALTLNPNYVYKDVEAQDVEASDTVNDADKMFTFASNGFIAIKAHQQNRSPVLGHSDINPAELQHMKQILAPAMDEIGDKQVYKGCVVHFLPGDNSHGDRYAPLKNVQEYMRMGVAGITNFLKFCDENEITDEMVLFGVTNTRMANLLCGLGFHTPDFKPGELKRIVKHKEDLRNESSVQIITNVAELRQMTKNKLFQSFKAQS